MMNILLNITAVIPTEMRMQQHILDFKGVSSPPHVVFRFSAYTPRVLTLTVVDKNC